MALTKVEAEQLQPAQTSITSVGTLTGLTSSGTLSITNQVAIRETAPGIQSGHSSAHSLQVGRWGGSNNRWMIVPEPEGSPLYSRELSYNFDTDTWAVEGSFAATLSTAAQPNITSVGTLTSLDVSGALTGTTAILTTSGNSAQLTLKSTDDDASVGPLLDLRRDSASPADNDVGGKIRFFGDNDAGESLSFGALTMTFRDVSDGTEDGQFEITSRLNGTNRSRFLTNETETVLNEDSQNLDFRVESNTVTHALSVNGSDGNVGIGMAASQLLDLNASSGLSIRFYNSGTFKAGLQVADSSGQMIGTSAANDFSIRSQSNLLFSAGGNTERMRINTSGNVGIGVVPETHFSGVDALQVGLGASLVGNTTNPSRTYLNANSYLNSSNAESYVSTDEASQYFQNAGTHIFKVAPSGSAGSAISWTTAMTIDNSGNVLVGSTDTSLYNNTSGGGIMLGGSGTNRLDVARDGDVAATFNRSSGAGEVINLYQGGSKAGGLGVSGTDITIGTGDTGITFEDAADTVHPVNFSSGAARTGAINLGKDAARFQHLYLSALLDIKSSTCSGFLQVGQNVLQFGTSTSDPLIFYTNNAERMRITNTGNLLVGRDAKNNGATDHGINLYNTGQIYLYVNGTGNTDAFRVYDGNGDLKAAIDSDGDYIDHSDINAKENIQDASSVLSTLSDVKVRSFTWKADGRNQDYGFIAQELKEVVPEAVSSPETEGEMWGVKYAKLVPMLVKAVQEQQATITALEARIVQLENK